MEDIGKITDYHAHVYYEASTRDKAEILRDALIEQFPDAVVGNWHDEAIGPHLDPMYQVAFEIPLYREIVPWLALNRDGLNVLVHPRTGESAADHTVRAIWMGERLAVKYDLEDHD
jgi:aromatic ring-cleaving dioxygenase